MDAGHRWMLVIPIVGVIAHFVSSHKWILPAGIWLAQHHVFGKRLSLKNIGFSSRATCWPLVLLPLLVVVNFASATLIVIAPPSWGMQLWWYTLEKEGSCQSIVFVLDKGPQGTCSTWLTALMRYAANWLFCALMIRFSCNIILFCDDSDSWNLHAIQNWREVEDFLVSSLWFTSVKGLVLWWCTNLFHLLFGALSKVAQFLLSCLEARVLTLHNTA